MVQRLHSVFPVQGAGSDNAAAGSYSGTVHSILLSIDRAYNSANLGSYGRRGKEKHFSYSSHSFSSASNS